MYQDILTQVGLTPNEATIYEFLLRSGAVPASEIIKKTTLQKGVVYNVLESLEEKSLVISKKKGKLTHFYPQHPNQLEELLRDQSSQLEKTHKNLAANLDALTSEFNLVSQKPDVRYFEGLEGIQEALEDTLTSQEIIYTYADLEAVIKYTEKINQCYMKKRSKLNLNKKVLVLDSAFAKNYLQNYLRDITEIKLIDQEKYPFSGSVMQIYEGKVIYISLSEEHKIAMLIQDPNIYQMHKSLFEFHWDYSRKLA